MKTLGVDLGTTNTLAALDGKLLTDGARGQAESILPSVVAFLPNGLTSVGAAARRRRPIDPQNTIFSAKRIIGRTWHSYEVSKFRETYPFHLVKTAEDRVAFETRAGVISPMDTAAKVLEAVCRRAELGPGDYRALITVPAQFDSAQRMATMEAGRNVGFADVAVFDEPIATAVAYVYSGLADVRYAAVYDLGGGTFDLAVVDCSRQPHQVLAHGGDDYLGGDDIDRALADEVRSRVLQEHHWDLKSDRETYDRLVLEVERVKVRLSYASETSLELGQVDPASPLANRAIRIGRETLEQASRPLVQRTFGICDEVLNTARLSREDLGAVFLAGGSTSLPMVRRDIAQYFGQPPHVAFDPMEVVAIGASLAGC